MTSRALSLAAFASAVAIPSPALAHFTLEAPASWMSQNALGDPLKLGPCGDEGGGTPTGDVTAFRTGGTVTVTIDEKIFHPGHYRVALAVADRSELPPEPPVTAGSTPCGSTTIQDPPVFPVLADGVFVHTSALSGPMSVDVQLPADVTCDKCTLQVIEFMSEHGLNDPGGCFYHHCADIKISDDGPPSSGGAGGADAGGESSGGCGCAVPNAGVDGAAAAAMAIAAALLRRRSRQS